MLTLHIGYLKNTAKLQRNTEKLRKYKMMIEKKTFLIRILQKKKKSSIYTNTWYTISIELFID